MSAFNSYVQKIENILGRKLSNDELTIALKLYEDGWHPARVAKHLNK